MSKWPLMLVVYSSPECREQARGKVRARSGLGEALIGEGSI